MKKRQKKQYGEGEVRKLWPFLVRLHAAHPEVFANEDLLKHAVSSVWIKLKDKERCPNCSASMATYRRKVDYFVVSLVVAMGRIVKDRVLKEGKHFTTANAIHVNADEGIPHNARNMTGIASALGLIAPHGDLKYHWVITARGWAALRGEAIPAEVVTFRDEIISRSEEKTTFAEAMAEHGGHEEREWYHIEGMAPGTLL